MKLVNFIIHKLAGYDIIAQKKELEIIISKQQQQQIQTLSIQKLNEKNSAAKQTILEINKTIENLNVKLQKQNEEKEFLLKENLSYKTKIQNLQDDLIKVGKLAIANEQRKQAEYDNIINSKDSTIKKLNSDIEQRHVQIEELKIQLQATKEQIAIYQKTQFEILEETNNLKNENNEKTDLIPKLQHSISQYQIQIEDLTSQISEINTEKEKLYTSIEKWETEFIKKESLIQSLTSKVNFLEKHKSSQDSIIAEHKNTIDILNKKIENNSNAKDLKLELESHIKKLQDTTAELDIKESLLKEAQKLAERRGILLQNFKEQYYKAKKQIEQFQKSLNEPNENKTTKISESTEEMVQFNSSPNKPMTESTDTKQNTTQQQAPISIDNTDIQEVNQTNDIDEDRAKNEPNSKKGIIKNNDTDIKASEEISDLPIIDLKTGRVKRSILQVIDIEHDNEIVIDADDFFSRDTEEIEHITRMLAEADESGRDAYICACCKSRVKISKRDYGNREVLFFSHCLRNIDCEWKQDNYRTIISVSEQEYNYQNSILNKNTLYKVVKDTIFKSLTSLNSQNMGITNVEKQKKIKSKYPFMYNRTACIYARFKGRDIVFEIQTKDVLLNTVVNKDIFYRLNDHHVLWVYDADEENGYEHIIKHVNLNIMYANRRNIFIMDKEAIKACHERGELVLKCNYLDSDNHWHYRKETTGNNGILITLKDLLFDDNMCKPYYHDANIDYFKQNPTAQKNYNDSIVSREKLLKDLKDTWEGKKAERRLKKQSEIQKEKDTNIRIREKSQYNEEISIDSTSQKIRLIEQKDRYLAIINGKYGIQNEKGEHIIPCKYDKIKYWSKGKYRVLLIDQWGIIDENNNSIIDIKYNSIGELRHNKALVKSTFESFIIDENGNRQDDETIILQNDWIKYKRGNKWGIKDKNGTEIVACAYDEIGSFRSRLIGIRKGSFQKLVPRFEYRMKIQCVCSDNDNGRGVYDINGITLLNFSKKPSIIGQTYTNKYISNISFSKNIIYINDLSTNNENKKFNHIDNDSDFVINEILNGTIQKIISKKYYVVFNDNRQTYFTISTLIKAGKSPTDYNVGTTICLRKIGFDSDFERTIWECL